MAFADLANNQSVSFTDAQSGGFALKSGQSHVTSSKTMSKDEALAKYNLNASSMSSFSGAQQVPKGNWTSGVVGNDFILCLEDHGTEASCSTFIYLFTVYSSSTSIAVGTVFYNDAQLTSVYAGRNIKHLHKSTSRLITINNSGVVTLIHQCPSGSLTLIRPNFASTGGSSVACTVANRVSVYGDTPDLFTATKIYKVSDGSTMADSGYYQIEGSYRFWNGGAFVGSTGAC